MAHYKTERDLPAVDGTSRLSPYLNIGILSIRQCMQPLFNDGYFQIDDIGQQTWLDELLWREFYLHTLFDFPRVSRHRPLRKIPITSNGVMHLKIWLPGNKDKPGFRLSMPVCGKCEPLAGCITGCA